MIFWVSIKLEFLFENWQNVGHPNVKLFIGHGGALSTQEAIFHGVPMICVPFLMDQFLNTQNVVTKKMGLELNIRNATSEDVYRTIREVLNNPMSVSYTQQTLTTICSV